MPPDDDTIAATIRHLLAQRAAGASICPSDAARALDASGWRTLMSRVRAVAAALAVRGEVVITQRGVPVDPVSPWRGPVRIRRGR